MKIMCRNSLWFCAHKNADLTVMYWNFQDHCKMFLNQLLSPWQGIINWIAFESSASLTCVLLFYSFFYRLENSTCRWMTTYSCMYYTHLITRQRILLLCFFSAWQKQLKIKKGAMILVFERHKCKQLTFF